MAIITGASSGIGEGTAGLFAAEGATLVLTARRTERLKALVETIEHRGGRALAVPADATLSGEVKVVADAAIAAYGKIDILVNNAGISDKHTATARTSDELWDEVIAADLTSVF